MGLNLEDFVVMSLVHGTDIVEVGKQNAGTVIEADALITSEVGVGLFMATGDCFPMVVYTEGKVALVHLGYQGVRKKLAQKIVEKFENIGNLKVFIGPGSRKESYVFEEVIQKDEPEWQPFLEKQSDGKTAVDVVGFIKKQLSDVGIKDIEDCGIDTVKDLNYFSHYRAVRTGEKEGRFATVACLPAGRL